MGIVVKSDPAQVLYHTLPYSYKGSGPTPIFDEFLNSISKGKKDVIQLLLAILSLAMNPDSRLQQLFLIYGEGKSLFLLLCQALAGFAKTATVASLALAVTVKATGKQPLVVDLALSGLGKQATLVNLKRCIYAKLGYLIIIIK
jgi:phage/plasmid-associated DNA primase